MRSCLGEHKGAGVQKVRGSSGAEWGMRWGSPYREGDGIHTIDSEESYSYTSQLCKSLSSPWQPPSSPGLKATDVGTFQINSVRNQDSHKELFFQILLLLRFGILAAWEQGYSLRWSSHLTFQSLRLDMQYRAQAQPCSWCSQWQFQGFKFTYFCSKHKWLSYSQPSPTIIIVWIIDCFLLSHL